MIKVGFWSGGYGPNDQYPNVEDHIDAEWSPFVKEAVLKRLMACSGYVKTAILGCGKISRTR